MQNLAKKEVNENKIHCVIREASQMGPKATKPLLRYFLGGGGVSRPYALPSKLGATPSFTQFAAPNSSSWLVVATVSILCYYLAYNMIR